MRIRLSIAASLIALTGLTGATFAQSTASQVKSINAFCKQIDSIQKRRKTPELVYANTADANSSTEKWRKFASAKALDKFRERNEVYDIAYNWRSGGRLIASTFTYSSQSGDWVNYVDHCFRADGTVARVETDYRTFLGDFKVLRKRYFNAAGRQISSSVRYLDLRSGKPKDKGDGVMGEKESSEDFYKTVKKLPFARLLPK